MDLSIREVATLLNRKPSTVRAQIRRGELAGFKRRGRWYVKRRDLPLNEHQRRTLQAKAESLRQTVEGVLPSRLARKAGRQSRSIVDLDAFRMGAELLAELRSAQSSELSEAARLQVVEHLEKALFALGEAAQQFDRELKMEALNRARSGLAKAVVALILEAGLDPPEPVATWVSVLECNVLAAVAGFARWTENLGKRRR